MSSKSKVTHLPISSIMWLMLFSIVLTQPVCSHQFNRSPFIIWKNTQVPVSPASTTYVLQMQFGHPCEKILEFGHIIRADVKNAHQQCYVIFHNQILLRLGTIWATSNPLEAKQLERQRLELITR